MTDSPKPSQTDAAARVRAESDSFVAQLERLSELEHKKRDIAPTDPRFLALAGEVEVAARALLDDAYGQLATGDAARTAGVDIPIALIPADLSAAQIMVGWRNAERQLSSLDPASVEAKRTRLAIDAYRRAYQNIVAERQKDDRRRTS